MPKVATHRLRIANVSLPFSAMVYQNFDYVDACISEEQFITRIDAFAFYAITMSIRHFAYRLAIEFAIDSPVPRL